MHLIVAVEEGGRVDGEVPCDLEEDVGRLPAVPLRHIDGSAALLGHLDLDLHHGGGVVVQAAALDDEQIGPCDAIVREVDAYGRRLVHDLGEDDVPLRR